MPTRPKRSAPRWFVAVVLVAIAALVPAAPASAHADLLATDPTDGSVLATAPQEITFQFTEAVGAQDDAVRLLDAQGEAVKLGEVRTDGPAMIAPIEDSLAEGSYVVAWRAVSADGHPIRGAFTFSVGRETTISAGLVDRAFASGNDQAYERVAAAVRALAYLGVLGAAGFVLVGAALRRPDDPTPVQRWVTVGALVGLVATVALIPIQAALVTGRGIGSIVDEGVLGLALSEGLGLSVLVTAFGLLSIVVTSGLPFEGAARRLALAGAVLAPLGFVLAGHTRSMSPAAVGYLADAAHVVAAAVWFGGLMAAIAAIRRRRTEGDAMGAAEAIASFSAWAGVSAAAVVVAGSVLGWIEVGSLDALTSTSYGKLLVAKVVAVAIALALAGWNRFRLVPRVAAAALAEASDSPDAPDESGRWTLLVRLMVAEVAVLTLALVATGALVAVTPAKVAASSGPVAVSAPLGEGTMDVTVDPAEPGRNDIHIYLLDDQGRPDDRFDEVTVELTLDEQDLGPFEAETVQVGPGHFQVVGADLALGGSWSLTVAVRPDRFTVQEATVTFDVG